MTIKGNRYFNDPGLAQAAGNLADLFGPPSGSDLSGYATANLKRQETEQRAQLWAQAAGDPDRQAVIADLYDPTQSYYAVDADTGAKKYATDIGASTLRANNAADNARILTTNTQDNLGKLYVEAYNNLGQGEVQPAIPEAVLSQFGGTTAVPSIAGPTKPLSETEVKGGALSDLIARTKDTGGQDVADELIKQSILGTDVTPTVDATGQPTLTNRFEAAGNKPVLTGEQKTPGGLDTYVDSAGKTFVGHTDAQGNVFRQDGTPAPNAQRKGAPSGEGANKLEGVDDYVALDEKGNEVPFTGYFDPADRRIHRADVPGNPVMERVVRKGVGSGALDIQFGPDGKVTSISQGSHTGKNPTAEQARANYVGIQAKPAVRDLLKAYDTHKLPTEGDYWRQYSLDNADKMDPGATKTLMDFVNEKYGRTSMTPEGQAYYANLNEVAPLELLIQSGAAVNEGEALRKQNQLKARPSDSPAVTAIRRRGLVTFLAGVDQWANGKIDKVSMPDLDAEIAKLGGDTSQPGAGAPAAAGGAPAAAAPNAPAAAQPAPAATAGGVAKPQTQEEFDALQPGAQYIDPDDPVNDDGTPKIVTK